MQWPFLQGPSIGVYHGNFNADASKFPSVQIVAFLKLRGKTISSILSYNAFFGISHNTLPLLLSTVKIIWSINVHWNILLCSTCNYHYFLTLQNCWKYMPDSRPKGKTLSKFWKSNLSSFISWKESDAGASLKAKGSAKSCKITLFNFRNENTKEFFFRNNEKK